MTETSPTFTRILAVFGAIALTLTLFAGSLATPQDAVQVEVLA